MNDPRRRSPHDPVDVEWQIEDVKNYIHTGVDIVNNAEAKAKKARAKFDLAFALAIGKTDGPPSLARFKATVATEDERRDADNAEIAYKHAERKLGGLEKELFALQSILKSAGNMFNAPGVQR